MIRRIKNYIVDRAKGILSLNALGEFYADLSIAAAHRRVEMLSEADELERQGFGDVAADLRKRASGIDTMLDRIDGETARVEEFRPPVAQLRAEPAEDTAPVPLGISEATATKRGPGRPRKSELPAS